MMNFVWLTFFLPYVFQSRKQTLIFALKQKVNFVAEKNKYVSLTKFMIALFYENTII